MSSNILFTNNYNAKNDDTLLFKVRENITDDDQLFQNYQEYLHFPYFGFNWNALNDCLSDLTWLKKKK